MLHTGRTCALGLFCALVVLVSSKGSVYVQTSPSTGVSAKVGRNHPRGSVVWLFYPLTEDSLAERYYEAKPVLLDRKRAGAYFGVLDGLFMSLQSSSFSPHPRLNHAFPALRATMMGKDAKPFLFWNKQEIQHAFPPEEIRKNQQEYKPNQQWDQPALHNTHSRGFSTIFLNTHLYDDKVAHPFLKDIAKQLGIFVQMNVYVTPGKQRGFQTHFDAHDVLVLQLFGRKNWRVYERPAETLPTNDWPYDKIKPYMKRKEHRKTVIRRTLNQGDARYIPRGYVHDADSSKLPGDSIHVSVGLLPPLWGDILYMALETVAASTNKGVLRSKRFPQDFLPLLKALVKNGYNNTGFRASPWLPFAVHKIPVQKDRNFNTYKKMVSDFVALPDIRALRLSTTELEMEMIKPEVWKNVLERYRDALAAYVNSGRTAGARYRPVSHNAHEVRHTRPKRPKRKKV